MMLSRTRKEIRTIENFYKEAGLCGEIENFYDKNTPSQLQAKKDRILLKKKAKLESSQKLEVKTTADKLQSDASEQNQRQSVCTSNVASIATKTSSQSTLPLVKMINKISILQVSQGKNVHGCYGHTTVIFKRPIIEGKYYLEFKMIKTNLGEGKAKIKTPPAIRIGLCPVKYSKNIPLGQDLSIGYKGSNGRLVYKGQEHEGGKGVKQGDVVGLCMDFSPPHKYQDQQKLWQQSQMKVLINGEQAAKCSKIYQCFYCPAFSLYNYGSVEVRSDKNSFQFCPSNYTAYGQIFSEAINYQQLIDTPSFAFLKLEYK